MYLPASQSSHSLAPTLLAYLPGTQLLHFVWSPPTEKSPAPQSEQTTAGVHWHAPLVPTSLQIALTVRFFTVPPSQGLYEQVNS